MINERDKAAHRKEVNEAVTPMMKQYLSIKSAHTEYLLFYRMGDFYELFFEDALVTADVLDIALTKRGKHNGKDIPMCGVPAHSSEYYLNKLLKAQHSIAICEQLESPEEARKRGYKAVVRREVVRIITPGTLMEESLLNARNNNYLCSVAEAKGLIGLSWVDISTGAFYVTQMGLPSLVCELSRLTPEEVIVSEKLLRDDILKKILTENVNTVTSRSDNIFSYERSENCIKEFFNIAVIKSLSDFSELELIAAGALLEYLMHTQKAHVPRLSRPCKVNNNSFMLIDPATRKHLELEHSASGNKQHALLGILNKTVTAAGARLMNLYMASPLLNKEAIEQRLDNVECFYLHPTLIAEVRERLQGLPDMERALSRITSKRAGPRDLSMIRDSMKTAIAAAELIRFSNIAMTLGIDMLVAQIGTFDDLMESLSSALAAELPIHTRDGGFIRAGYSSHLDRLYDIKENSSKQIEHLRAKYRNISGVSNLKVLKNNVIGYFIEVTPANASRMKNKIFSHKQSLGSAIRYSTEELKKLEADIILCDERIKHLELEIFDALCQKVVSAAEDITLTAQSVANIDVITTLAHIAVKNKYTRPKVEESKILYIKGGRHPVVERRSSGQFIENSCHFDNENLIWLLTGPNMAGKSTFLRQNALIVIMAQMGSFVPAQQATIGIVDRLFSRIGAADNIAAGQSTFMVEMLETAYILHNATSSSLLILDEIGRGTSTYDGLAIAWAIIEYINNIVKGRTLFATHYHELTALENLLEKVECYTMKVKEWENEVIFMHEIVKGKADRSYGIHVAEMSGIPICVTKRAYEILGQFNKEEKPNYLSEQLPLAIFETHNLKRSDNAIALIKKISEIDVDCLSPRDALSILYELKKLTNNL